MIQLQKQQNTMHRLAKTALRDWGDWLAQRNSGCSAYESPLEAVRDLQLVQGGGVTAAGKQTRNQPTSREPEGTGADINPSAEWVNSILTLLETEHQYLSAVAKVEWCSPRDSQASKASAMKITRSLYQDRVQSVVFYVQGAMIAAKLAKLNTVSTDTQKAIVGLHSLLSD